MHTHILHTYPNTSTYIHTQSHTYTNTHTHICTLTHIHIHISHIYSTPNTCIHTQSHTHTHTHILHTYPPPTPWITHSYTLTWLLGLSPRFLRELWASAHKERRKRVRRKSQTCPSSHQLSSQASWILMNPLTPPMGSCLPESVTEVWALGPRH